jgi:hypothetical protein
VADTKSSPIYQAQFQELATLIEQIQSGVITGDAAIEALRRVHDLMSWSADEQQIADEVDYLIA